MPPNFPHWGRPIGPDSAVPATRQNERKWLYYQACGEIGNADRQRMALTDGLHRIIVGAKKEAADCEYPLYITPQMAEDFATVQHMVMSRRMERLQMPDYHGANLRH